MVCDLGIPEWEASSLLRPVSDNGHGRGAAWGPFVTQSAHSLQPCREV